MSFLLPRIIGFGRPDLKFGMFGALLLFVSFMLLLFLNFASYKPSKSFSEMYLIRVTNNSTFRAGYFRMCETVAANSTAFVNSTISASSKQSKLKSSTIICSSIKNFKGSGPAYEFAQRISRPYFLIISTILTGFALAFAIVSGAILRNSSQKFSKMTALGSIMAVSFTVLTACWQQVAVQAAVVLLNGEVKRGNRAGAMVWSAVALEFLAAVSLYKKAASCNPFQSNADAEAPNDNQSMWTNTSSVATKRL